MIIIIVWTFADDSSSKFKSGRSPDDQQISGDAPGSSAPAQSSSANVPVAPLPTNLHHDHR
jgi:hypothetical protein